MRRGSCEGAPRLPRSARSGQARLSPSDVGGQAGVLNLSCEGAPLLNTTGCAGRAGLPRSLGQVDRIRQSDRSDRKNGVTLDQCVSYSNFCSFVEIPRFRYCGLSSVHIDSRTSGPGCDGALLLNLNACDGSSGAELPRSSAATKPFRSSPAPTCPEFLFRHVVYRGLLNSTRNL